MTNDRATLEEAEVVARKIGSLIGAVMPPGWGFMLVLGTYGEGGCLTYVSSVEREGAIAMLKEMIAKIERGEPNL